SSLPAILLTGVATPAGTPAAPDKPSNRHRLPRPPPAQQTEYPDSAAAALPPSPAMRPRSSPKKGRHPPARPHWQDPDPQFPTRTHSTDESHPPHLARRPPRIRRLPERTASAAGS